jgi:hypothetical protein
LTTNAAGGTGTIHTAVLKFHRDTLGYAIDDATVTCDTDGSTYTVGTSFDGTASTNPWVVPVFAAYPDTGDGEFDFTGLGDLVGLTFDTNTKDLGDTYTITVNIKQAAVFTYRVQDIWVTTDSGNLAYDAIPTSAKKFKIFENGCSNVPCWTATTFDSSTLIQTASFNAFGFAGDAMPQTVYLSATVVACDIGDTDKCQITTCTTCTTQYTPTGRRRRSQQQRRRKTKMINTEYNLLHQSYQFSNETGSHVEYRHPTGGDTLLISSSMHQLLFQETRGKITWSPTQI